MWQSSVYTHCHTCTHTLQPRLSSQNPPLLLFYCGRVTLGTIVLLGFYVPPLLLQPIALQVMFHVLCSIEFTPHAIVGLGAQFVCV